MNAGFANLDTLKKQLLAKTLSNDKRFDDLILAIGLGVAGQFEKFCNRKFARVVNDKYVISADRDHAYVLRYPIETYTSIELKADINTGWEMQTGLVLNINEVSGLIYWGAGISFQWAQMRITYTGGYWWNMLEPDDPAFPDQLPAGAVDLPDDVRMAWLLQCWQVWSALDKTGGSLLKSGSDKVHGGLPTLALIPTVKSTLAQFTRYSLI